MSKLVSSSARRTLMFLFGLVVSGLALAAIFKAVRQHGGSAKTAVPRAPSVPKPSVTPPSATASAVPSVAPARPPLLDESPDNIPAQHEVLLKNMQSQLGLEGEALAKTRAIIEASRWMGQGNPKITKHPMTRAECLAIHQAQPFHAADARCGAPNMVLAFNPAVGETKDLAKLCIDQYEYPNIACDYPVIWVKSDEAENLCKAQGKRLCDAHEWEGACAGAVLPAEQEYTFGKERLLQEYLHNKSREMVWAYGKEVNQKLCATGSSKSSKCYAPSWEECGSNTYPAGSFPECVSPLGVYDQHGNAAEHMNLPLVAEELGSRGGTGENEMKGSWFIFQQLQAHEDDCRWRSLAWHRGKLMAKDAHRNYHLSFRCCKDL